MTHPVHKPAAGTPHWRCLTATLQVTFAAMVFGPVSTARAEPKGQLMSFALPAKTLLREMGANSNNDQKDPMGQMSVAAYSLASLLQNANATGVEFRGAKPANLQFYPDDSELTPSPAMSATKPTQPRAFGQEIIVEGRPWFVVKFESKQRSDETKPGSAAVPNAIAQGLLCATAAGLNCIQAPGETSGNETRFRWTENGEIQTWKLVLNGSPCDDFSKCQIISSSWSRQLRLEGLRRGTGLSLSPNQVALSSGNTLSLLDLDTRKTWAALILPSQDSQQSQESLTNAIGYGSGQVLLEWSKLRILLDFANDSCLVLNGTNLLRCRQGLASLLKSRTLHEAGAPASNLAPLFDFHGSEAPKSTDAIALSNEGAIYGRTVYSLATRQRTELEASPSRAIASLDGTALRLIAAIPSPQGDRLALRQLFNTGKAAATAFPDTNIQLPQGFPEWTLLFSKKSSLFITSQGVFQLQNGGRLLPTSIALPHDAVSFLPESGGAFIRRGKGSSCNWYHVRQHPTFENSFSESGAAIGCDGRVQFNASYGAVFATRVTPTGIEISASQLNP